MRKSWVWDLKQYISSHSREKKTRYSTVAKVSGHVTEGICGGSTTIQIRGDESDGSYSVLVST